MKNYSFYVWLHHKLKRKGTLEILDKLRKSQWHSTELIEEYQLDMLKDIILYAKANTVYYRESLSRIGLADARDIKSIRDITKIAILTNKDVRDNLDILTEILAQLGMVRVSTEVMETLRVERGAPGAGRELSEAYTPLEVGFEATVAFQKGCYTGQEVIARQLTYDKVTRRLVGLYLDQPVRESAQVLVEGKPAGEISSQTISPRFGAIALAVLKRPNHEPGTEVVIQPGDQIIRAVVTGLPFTKTRQDL